MILAWGLAASMASAFGGEPVGNEALRIAVYDVPPYGYVSADGSIVGASVDLWRRVAEQIARPFVLTPVSEIEAILGGLEQGRFDAAIGAITITPDRLERVDFSYPAHRSGVAVAFRRENGPLAVLSSYGAAVSELMPLILLIVVMLGVTGLAMWRIEKSHPSAAQGTESAVATLRDGLYWAVVTMTTVGYGDKTPKTHGGRAIAILWMFGSLVLISLLSTSLVSRLTAERVENSEFVYDVKLDGKKLAAVAHSSGAEYLEKLRLPYTKYKDLPEALDSLTDRRSDAVVNSVGALQYLISDRYRNSVELSRGLLAPAYMAFALPRNSALARRIDLALIRITAGEEWRSLEARFFGR
jgi:polar amino acid transport system substrate-binding protein